MLFHRCFDAIQETVMKYAILRRENNALRAMFHLRGAAPMCLAAEYGEPVAAADLSGGTRYILANYLDYDIIRHLGLGDGTLTARFLRRAEIDPADFSSFFDGEFAAEFARMSIEEQAELYKMFQNNVNSWLLFEDVKFEDSGYDPDQDLVFNTNMGLAGDYWLECGESVFDIPHGWEFYNIPHYESI